MREAKFDQLVRRHAGAVQAYARALCRDQHAAEEVVQETFLRAWKYLDSFRGDGSFEGWLLRICRNCVIDRAQRDRPTTPFEVHRLDRPEPPDTSAEVSELIQAIPLAQREVFVLCALLGYSYDDAAALLSIPVGTVRSRLARARTSLQASLTGEHAERDTA